MALSFSEPVFSDGRWVRLCIDDGGNSVFVMTNAESPDAAVLDVIVVGDPEYEGDVFVFAVAAMNAAAHVGQMGQYAMNLLIYGQLPDAFELGSQYWWENGYQLSFGHTASECPMASVTYTADAPDVDDPLQEKEFLNFMNNGVTLDMLSTYIPMFAPVYGFEKIAFSPDGGTAVDDEQLNMRAYEWEDCVVFVGIDRETDEVQYVSIVSLSGDTVSLWGRTLLLYFGASGASFDMLLPLSSLIVDDHGTWEDLIALQPYALYHDTVLFCYENDDIGLCSIISGLGNEPE